MSRTAMPVKTLGTRAMQLAALLVTTALLGAITRVAPNFHGPAGVIASVGFLLLAGMLTSELLETVGLPHLTGYLAVGLVAGPHVLDFVDHVAVDRLQGVNTLALTLIALAGGVELEWGLLKSRVKSLLWANGVQSVVLLVSMTAAFFFIASDLEFMNGLSHQHVLAVGVLWAVLAISRSPSATLAILAQTRAQGPLARFALAFVMSSDVVVIILLSLAMSVVRPMFDASSDVSLAELVVLGHEILGSVTVGTSLGLGLALYLRLFGRQILLIILGLAYVAGEAIGYLRFDPLLTFLIAGFVVRNFSRQGPLLLSSVERTGSVVFVLFFATAGAHLDVPLLLRLWPTALLLCGARIVATFVAQALASRQALDPPSVRRWGFAPLVSQAGLTLGLSVVVERTFPQFGAGLRSLVIATVAMNEVVGPILFKFALDRTGESGARLSIPPKPEREGVTNAPPGFSGIDGDRRLPAPIDERTTREGR